MDPLIRQSGSRHYAPSRAASDAGHYYNALKFEEREKLAPLLEHYRQMGIAEAASDLRAVLRRTDERIRSIRDA